MVSNTVIDVATGSKLQYVEVTGNNRFSAFLGESIWGMEQLGDQCVDLILCDPPQGITAAKWDVILPFDKLWEQYRRLLKPTGCCVIFGNMPFTADLVCSNKDWFKYEIIWEKSKASNPANCHIRPMRAHENIEVFAPSWPRYFPQMVPGKPYNKGLVKAQSEDDLYGKHKQTVVENKTGDRYPRTVQYVPTKESERGRPSLHKTQKPQKLLQWLIKTYSLPGELVLDNTAGSFSTGVAALETGREFIGIELNEGYYRKGLEWLLNTSRELSDVARASGDEAAEGV